MVTKEKRKNNTTNLNKKRPGLVETLQILAHVVVNCLKRNE